MNLARVLFAHKNLAPWDRAGRVLLGAGLLWLAVTGRSALGWFGILSWISAAAGSCPCYKLLGWSTCKISNGSDS